MTCTNCGADFREGDKVREVTEGIYRERCGPAESPDADAVEITKTIKMFHLNCQYPRSYDGD